MYKRRFIIIDTTSVVYRFKWLSVPTLRLLFLAEETDVTLKLNMFFIAELERRRFSDFVAAYSEVWNYSDLNG